MQSMGLTADERRAFEEALCKSHTRRIKVTVTDLDGKPLSSITPVLLDGQVVVDYDAPTSRTLTLQFSDPHRALSFDTDSPDDGALYADRMVQVDYSIYVTSLARYVSVTVFHGPVTYLERAGDVVNIEAQGKETMAHGAIWRTLSLAKGLYITDAIKILMRDRAGEKKFAFAASSSRIPSTRPLDRFAEIWATAKALATSINRSLFYDGSGVLVLRAYPNTPVYTFRTGKGGNILSDVQVAYELADVKNVVVVEGSPPKGSKTKPRYEAIAPADHVLSPARLGPIGAPKYLVDSITDDSIRSSAAAKTRAKSLLEDRLREVVTVTFDSLPVPHLDAGDMVSIVTDDFSTTVRIRQFTIPLGTSGDPVMPVGYLKRTALNRKRFRK